MSGPRAKSAALPMPDGSDLVRRPGAFYEATLTGTITLDATYPEICKLDPGGAGRQINLDAYTTTSGPEGLMRKIINAADAAEALTVKDVDASTTVASIAQNEQAWFYCDGTNWKLLAIETIALS